MTAPPWPPVLTAWKWKSTTTPRHAWSDGAQCLTPDAFAQAMAKCRQVAWAIGREM